VWLNNCVGTRTYHLFLSLLSVGAVTTAVVATVCIAIVIHWARGDEGLREGGRTAYGKPISGGLLVAIAVLTAVLVIVTCYLLVDLLILHSRLVQRGWTTYDYIVHLREQDCKRSRGEKLDPPLSGPCAPSTRPRVTGPLCSFSSRRNRRKVVPAQTELASRPAHAPCSTVSFGGDKHTEPAAPHTDDAKDNGHREPAAPRRDTAVDAADRERLSAKNGLNYKGSVAGLASSQAAAAPDVEVAVVGDAVAVDTTDRSDVIERNIPHLPGLDTPTIVIASSSAASPTLLSQLTVTDGTSSSQGIAPTSAPSLRSGAALRLPPITSQGLPPSGQPPLVESTSFTN
jgi:hypothetical protein